MAFGVFFLVDGFIAFFVTVFAATLALADGLASLLNLDFILAALFLWIKPFLTALSTAETAFLTFSVVLLFMASLTASLKVSLKKLLAFVLFLSCLNFFLADFITGMRVF